MIDGANRFLGVDNSSYFRKPGFLKHSVNRTFRKQLNSTRPPFKEWSLSFYDSEDKDVFLSGAIKKIFFYRGVKNVTNPFLIVYVHDRILAGTIYSKTISFYPAIHKGLSESAQMGYFCRAENILVFQNNVDSPMFWRGGFVDGEVQKMSAVYESTYVDSHPMPKGKMMVYCHGRIFVATDDDLIYASDHIYSQGIAARDTEAVLRFSESTYPSSGDGFGAPSEMGKVTGLAAVKRAATNDGYGEVLVLQEDGAFSIDPTPVRNTWTNQSIQKTLFIGSGTGCGASDSVLAIGGDIFYRNSIGQLSTLKYSYNQVISDYESDSFSEPVYDYLTFDNTALLKFSRSLFVDKYALFTTNIKTEQSKLGGLHIFSKGMIPIDFLGSETNFSFNGIWTGPRVIDCVAVSSGDKSSVFASHDSDGVNRLYYLESEYGDDYIAPFNRKIQSFYIQGGLLEDKTLQTRRPEKQFIKYIDGTAPFSIESKVAENGSVDYYEMIPTKVIGDPESCVKIIDCNVFEPRKLTGVEVSDRMCKGLNDSDSFKVKTSIEGSATIVYDVVHSEDIVSTMPKKEKQCKSEQSYKCSNEEDLFNYQF